MGTYVTFYSTRKGHRKTQVQVAKLPSINLNPNSTKKQRIKQIYETTLQFLRNFDENNSVFEACVYDQLDLRLHKLSHTTLIPEVLNFYTFEFQKHE